MFQNQPKGLYALALANTGERFGYLHFSCKQNLASVQQLHQTFLRVS